MKVNYEPLWKTVLFPKWNHMGSELTTGLFDFSNCNVAIETFSFPLCLSLHCCNKLDIISASTLWSLRGLECVDQLLKVGFKSKASVIAKSWHSHTALMCLQSLQVIRSSEKNTHVSSNLRCGKRWTERNALRGYSTVNACDVRMTTVPQGFRLSFSITQASFPRTVSK